SSTGSRWWLWMDRATPASSCPGSGWGAATSRRWVGTMQSSGPAVATSSSAPVRAPRPSSREASTSSPEVPRMGYNVGTSGRLNLPESDDTAAVAAVKAACAGRRGWFRPEEASPSATLADLAWVGAASIARDGDWIQFGDSDGDPKWSQQAEAFY